MTTHKEALTLAREALVRADRISGYPNNKQTITAIDEALAQPEQPKVRTGDCLLVGVCASEGHKIQKAQPEHEKYCPICQGVGQVDTGIMESPVTICNACNGAGLKAQPEQEPYCWTWDEFISGGKWRAEYGWKKPERKVTNLQPLYTTPPQRTWVDMTDEEILAAPNNLIACIAYVRNKLKEKNNA